MCCIQTSADAESGSPTTSQLLMPMGLGTCYVCLGGGRRDTPVKIGDSLWICKDHAEEEDSHDDVHCVGTCTCIESHW